MKPSPRIAALVLLVLGFAIRFWASAHARFTGDESHYWFVSRQLATLKTFPVYGPEITGSEAHLPGALYYYLMAIPQLLGSSPRFGATAVILGHLVSAWLFYLLLEKARGERAALFGLMLAMITPWDVLYSDRIWGSCVVPILGSVALYAAVRAKESGTWQGVLIAVNLVLPQLHLSSPVLWVACAAIVWFRRPERWDRKAILIALGVVFVAYLPMLIAEIGSGFSNTRMIFTKAGGKEPWSKSLLSPIQMIVYAVFYGSAELSYHFDRGYWGGYDDLTRYASMAGWKRWLDREGIGIAILTVVSVLTSAALWIAALFDLIRHRKKLALEHVMLLGLLAGLLGGIGLLLPSRKAYFPHYANVLMPMMLWPLALSLDRVWSSKLRWAGMTLLSMSAAAMVINVVRYYTNVDGLNGLSPTMEMVDAAFREERSIDVSFEHFNNAYAWSAVARGVHGRELSLDHGAVLRWRVKNGARFTGDPPEGARLFGPVLVQTEERTRHRPPRLRYRASEQWRSIEVTGKTTCKAATGAECRYGDQPWQHMKPDAIEMRGRSEPVLFLHPITDRPVVARMTIPAGIERGMFVHGLSDAALKSSNPAPVSFLLRQGSAILLSAETDRKTGLKASVFTVTGTAALELEIRTTDDGARVFGFDVDLF